MNELLVHLFMHVSLVLLAKSTAFLLGAVMVVSVAGFMVLSMHFAFSLCQVHGGVWQSSSVPYWCDIYEVYQEHSLTVS